MEVVAPGKTPRGWSDRVKTDRKDAELLARLLLAGSLTRVVVPPPEIEAARELTRAHDDGSNSNVLTVTGAGGNAASTAYSTTATYDANDNLTGVSQPDATKASLPTGVIVPLARLRDGHITFSGREPLHQLRRPPVN